MTSSFGCPIFSFHSCQSIHFDNFSVAFGHHMHMPVWAFVVESVRRLWRGSSSKGRPQIRQPRLLCFFTFLVEFFICFFPFFFFWSEELDDEEELVEELVDDDELVERAVRLRLRVFGFAFPTA